MQRPQLSIVLGSLLGAGVLHFILVACSTSSGGGAKTGVPDAQAQGTPSCTAWVVSTFFADNVLNETGFKFSPGLGSDIAIPSGWEPISGVAQGSTTAQGDGLAGMLVVIRKCAQ
jgi:hypothetical protein